MEPNLLEKQDASQPKYAGFWIRFAASLLDSIIVGIPFAILVLVIIFITLGSMDMLTDPSVVEGNITEEQAIMVLFIYFGMIVLSFIVSVAYYAGMHSSKWQATVGKKLLKLKVTDLRGNRISSWRAFGRLLAMILSGIFYIGYIIAAFTDKKQSLHDLIAGTVVIQEENE